MFTALKQAGWQLGGNVPQNQYIFYHYVNQQHESTLTCAKQELSPPLILLQKLHIL